MSYPYNLPNLPYEYNALEPYIDELTMHVHHDKHHQGYITKLNDALSKWPEGQKQDLVHILSKPDLIPENIRTAVINNGGGAWIHEMFWNIIGFEKDQIPSGELAHDIAKTFGSFESFKDQFSVQAASFFGSGWIWLVITPEKSLKIVTTQGHDLPQVHGFQPILVLDVWEHAYYLKYQNRRQEYIQNWWYVVNWKYVYEKYAAMKHKGLVK